MLQLLVHSARGWKEVGLQTVASTAGSKGTWNALQRCKVLAHVSLSVDWLFVCRGWEFQWPFGRVVTGILMIACLLSSTLL